MAEIRRDTDKLHREDIERAFASHHRDTLPIPIVLELASSQGLDAVPCPACGCGVVAQALADRVAEAIAVEPAEETITVDEVAQ